MLKKLLYISALFIITGCSSTSYIQDGQYSSKTHNEVIKHGELTNSERNEIVATAKLMLNTKYKYGGKKPDFGVDCSGFVTYVFKTSIDYKITGAARHMAKIGKTIHKSHTFENKLAIGDLLFFNTTGKSFSHVGIYIGDGKFIHASSGRGRVIITDVNQTYYKKRLELVKRL